MRVCLCGQQPLSYITPASQGWQISMKILCVHSLFKHTKQTFSVASPVSICYWLRHLHMNVFVCVNEWEIHKKLYTPQCTGVVWVLERERERERERETFEMEGKSESEVLLFSGSATLIIESGAKACCLLLSLSFSLPFPSDTNMRQHQTHTHARTHTYI